MSPRMRMLRVSGTGPIGPTKTDKHGWCEPCRESKHRDCWQNPPWYNCRCPVCRVPKERR